MSIKLELNNFRHVSSDEHCTTLQHHKDGHQIILAHKALSPKNKEQLIALKEASDKVKPSPKENKEEPRKKFAMGGMEEEADDQNNYRIPDIEMPPEGATMADLVQTKPMEEGQEFAPTPTPIPGMEGAVGTPPVDPAVIAENQASSAGNPIETGIEPQMPAQQSMPNSPSGLDLMNKGLANEAAGINADVKAQTALGQQELDIYKRKEEAQKLYNQEHAAKRSEIQSRIDASRQAVAEAKINPEQYWTGDKEGKGGHSKWLSAIGMILAGFDPAGRPNMAIKVLEHQMEQNIQSQKENLGTKKSLLEANMRELKDVNDAEALTRIQLNDITQSQLAQAAAASRSPLAQAAAQKAIGELQVKQSKEFDALTTSQAKKGVMQQLSGIKNDPAKMDQYLAAMDTVDPKQATALRERKVPGVGFADTKEGAKNIRELQIIQQTAKEGINRLKEMVGKSGKSLNPNLRKEAQTIQSSLVGLLRVPMTGPGAMSDGERELLLSMIANPTNFFSIDSNSKKALETLQGRIDSNLNNSMKVNGLNVKSSGTRSPAANNSQALAWAKANPQDPRAAKILKQLGQ